MPRPKPGEEPLVHPMTPEQLKQFEELYTSHRLTLLVYIPRWNAGYLAPQDVEDIAAEAWTKAFRMFTQYKDRGNGPVNWMNVLAKRTLIDWHRRREVRPRTIPMSSPATEDASGVRTFEEVLEAQVAGEASADQEPHPRTQRAVSLVFKLMSPRQAQVHALRLEGLSHKEIAERMGTTTLASKKLLNEGQKVARIRLERLGVRSPERLLCYEVIL